MIRLSADLPDPDAFIALRAACGWGTIPLDQARDALAASLTSVIATEDGRLIAMGRAVGDGALYIYLQDIVVAPSHRGTGLGRALIARLLSELAPLARPGTTIGLMSAAGLDCLYTEFGFTPRPTDTLGPGMTMVVP